MVKAHARPSGIGIGSSSCWIYSELTRLNISWAHRLSYGQTRGFLLLWTEQLPIIYEQVNLGQEMRYFVTQWANLDSSIVAVSHICKFQEQFEQDEDEATQVPRAAWPDYGAIDFQLVTASHKYLAAPSIYNCCMDN